MNELVKVERVNDVLVTDSRRVAKELGVKHFNLLIKINDYVNKFSSLETSSQFYIQSKYKDRSGKSNKNYLITEKGIAQLIGGYSSAVEKAFDLNVAYINEFDRMKNQLQNQFQVPTTFKEALLLAVKQQEEIENLQLENKIKEQKIVEYEPKVEYYDNILQDTKGLLTVSQIAKDYNLSARELNRILHEEKVQYKQGGKSGQWLLYSQYMNKGYTKSITWDNGGKTGLHTKWKQKGRLFIHELLKKRGIHAIMDIENDDVEY